MGSKAWDKAYAALEERKASRTASIVLIDGNQVVSVHQDSKEANVALCAALDSFFEANPTAEGHSMDIVPCAIVPQVGQKLPYEVRL